MGETPLQIKIIAKADGTFESSAQRFWGIYIAPMDVFGPWTEAVVTAPGYETVTVKLAASAMGPSKVVLGDLKLHKLH
jgi:hypothetical protein